MHHSVMRHSSVTQTMSCTLMINTLLAILAHKFKLVCALSCTVLLYYNMHMMCVNVVQTS